MKTFKNSTQKIIITIIALITIILGVPTYSHADVGGVLASPFINFASFIGDSIMSGLQFFMYDGSLSNSAGGMTQGLLATADKISELKQKYPELEYDNSEGNATLNISSDDLDRGIIKSFLQGFDNKDDFIIPIIKYTPEKIFSGKVPALDINFISPQKFEDENMNNKSITQALQEIIASWYVALRNLAIVGLLSVLVYVGIRIVISSTASDKAKYKQMLMDWIIALCILFVLHYIMYFVIFFTEQITEGIGSNSKIAISVSDTGEESGGNVQFNTDLTGAIRFQIQYKDLGARAAYMILYLAAVIYTCRFTFTYVKRSITMAFLTLMAPVVALTYPLDKIKDGRAQAFDMWIKEYIFNALIQPFHLIIYTVFIGSAMNIAGNNPIYAIMVFAFINQAEKLLRKFFGFEKAGTAGSMSTAAGMFGAAATMKAVSGVLGKGAKGGSGGSGAAGGKGQNSRIRTDDNAPKGLSAFAGGNFGDNYEGYEEGNKENTSEEKGENTGIRTSPNTKGSITDGNNNGANMQDEINGTYDPYQGEAPTPAPTYGDEYLDAWGARPTGQDSDQSIRTVEGEQEGTPEIQDPYANINPIGTEQNQQTANGQNNVRFANTDEGTQQEGGSNHQMSEEHGRDGVQSVGDMPSANSRIRMQQDSNPTPSLENGSQQGNNIKQKSWTQDDTRGMGQWMKDNFNAKYGESKPIKMGRTIGNGIKGIPQMPSRLGNKIANSNMVKGIPKPIRNTVRGAGAVLGKTGKSAIKTGATLAAKGATAAAFGAIGVAAGITGEDLDDVLKYGMAGVALGATAGHKGVQNLVGGIGNTISNTSRTYREAAYGVNEARMAEQTAAFKKDKEKREVLAQEFLGEDGKRLKKEELDKVVDKAAYFNNTGITDIDDITKAVNMQNKIEKSLRNKNPDMKQEEAQERARAQALTIAKMVKTEEIRAKDLRSKEGVEKLRNNYIQRLQKADENMSTKQATANANHIIELLKMYKKVDK